MTSAVSSNEVSEKLALRRSGNVLMKGNPLSLRFSAFWSVDRIPLRSRNDPRPPEKSFIAAQTYFFDDSSVHATFNPELGLHPLGLRRSGCRKNL